MKTKNPSDDILTLATTVVNAHKEYSRRKIIKMAFKSSSTGNKLLFLLFAVLFIIFFILYIFHPKIIELTHKCIESIPNVIWFVFSVITELASLYFFKKIIDTSSAFEKYNKKINDHFGSNYRYQRYEKLKETFTKEGINLKKLNSINKILDTENKLRESYGSYSFFVTSIILPMIVSLTTSLTNNKNSSTTLEILFCLIIFSYFYYLWKRIFPGSQYAEQELKCFLTWYEEELINH